MKEIIEAVGEVVTEIIGLAGVVSGLFAAIILLRTFGDNFIVYFI